MEKASLYRLLQNALKRIRNRAEPLFSDPLAIRFHEGDPDLMIDRSFHYIAIVYSYRWLWVIPRKKYTQIFAVSEVSYAGSCPKVKCLADRSVENIAEEEMRNFSTKTGVAVDMEIERAVG